VSISLTYVHRRFVAVSVPTLHHLLFGIQFSRPFLELDKWVAMRCPQILNGELNGMIDM
jgi:hypothetical protein